MSEVTKKSNVIIPEVMASMINAKIEALLRLTPYAKVDTTLKGVPGDTVTVPAWNYVGDAEDFDPDTAADTNGEIETRKLTASTTQFGVKCAAISIGILQTAINSGMGNPIGQGELQLAKSIAGKVEKDVLAAALTCTNAYDGSGAKIGYDGIVDAIDVFDEEENTEKVMFINPKQVSTLRKDANFIDKNKFGGDVMVSGAIGKIANTYVKVSKRIEKNEAGAYVCPIIKLEPASAETEFTEEELPALTIYLKADTQVDHEWFPKKQRHDVTATRYYGAALTNASKVVLATFKA